MTGLRELTAPAMALRTATILLVFVVVFTALLAGAYRATRPAILATAAAERMRLISEVLPASVYDNDPLAARISIADDPRLGNAAATIGYRAMRGGKASAVVLEATAPDGYAGRIRLLLAVDRKLRILGVRVLEHRETPSLGDYIEPKKDRNKTRPWITQFDGQSLLTRPLAAWRVRKDGGEFDAYAGATVTPRAVIKTVAKALQFVEAEQATLFDDGAEKRP
ncbi:MAG TPA: electron transport complex subunit RsxG [Rhodocyclaceae bacterium]